MGCIFMLNYIEAMNIRKEMCDYYWSKNGRCNNHCELKKFEVKYGSGCYGFIVERAEIVEPILEKWREEHK